LTAPVRIGLEAIRLVVAVVLIMVALAVTYRLGPDRDAARMRWVSTGAVVATLIWLLASIGFSIYVQTFGNYAKTYGSLAAAVILMLWLWLTAYAVLLGAEINAEAEQQTARDTTKGEPRPLGRRDAVKADSIPS
jgi:membrane protein